MDTTPFLATKQPYQRSFGSRSLASTRNATVPRYHIAQVTHQDVTTLTHHTAQSSKPVARQHSRAQYQTGQDSTVQRGTCVWAHACVARASVSRGHDGQRAARAGELLGEATAQDGVSDTGVYRQIISNKHDKRNELQVRVCIITHGGTSTSVYNYARRYIPRLSLLRRNACGALSCERWSC